MKYRPDTLKLRTVRFGIYLDTELHAALKLTAIDDQTSVTALIEDLIRKYITGHIAFLNGNQHRLMYTYQLAEMTLEQWQCQDCRTPYTLWPKAWQEEVQRFYLGPPFRLIECCPPCDRQRAAQWKQNRGEQTCLIESKHLLKKVRQRMRDASL